VGLAGRPQKGWRCLTHSDSFVTNGRCGAGAPDSGVTDVLLQEQCPTDPVEHIGMASDSPAMQNVLNWLSQSPNPSFKAKCENFGIDL
jgi:hypothetical protein